MLSFLDSQGWLCHSGRMGRRPAYITQASIARAIRAAKANGAAAVEVQQPDGTIIRIVINATPLALDSPPHCATLERSAFTASANGWYCARSFAAKS